MKRPNNRRMGFAFSSWLLCLAVEGWQPLGRARLAGLADMQASLQNISDALKGIQSFFTSLSNISVISNVIGLETILLLVVVIIFSTGLSALGVPKGKLAFLLSLLTADCLWFLWKASMKDPFQEFMPQILKSNLVVLSPFLAVSVLAAAVPFAWKKLKRRMAPLLRRGRAIDKKTLRAVYDEYLANSAALHSQITSEILGSGENEKIAISGETSRAIEDLRATLLKFDTKKKKQEVSE